MTPCPTDEELRQLLAGTLPAAAAGPLTRHTDACAACQRRLGQLLDDATAGRWRELLRPAGDDPCARTRLEPTVAAGSAARPVAPPAPPGYELLGELGRGGMGVVYRARQEGLKRLVALKVLGAGAWAGAEEVARFRAEAEAVARLQHPNIVQVYEVGEHDGRPFFSLEYVEGGSLAQRLDGTPLPARDAAELVRTLAVAIHAAHERGVVHRDLKPANVLLSFSGRRALGGAPDAPPRGRPLNEAITKIADFGLAKRLGNEDGLTRTGQIMGTPSYMAPEQARGDVHQIGPAADVYALGAILYELLTGRPPFKGATALETLQQVVSQPPVPPTRLQPKMPRDLETVCLKCLEKEAPRRYASAAALADDLGRFLAGQPIRARPATAPERVRKWAKRRPAVAALLVVLIAAPLVLIAGGVWYNVRVSQSADLAMQRSRKARAVVDDVYTNVAEEWLAFEPQEDPLRKEFLERALNHYQELAGEDDDEPDARRGRALAYFRVGQLRRMLSQHDGAAAAYRQAIDLQEQLHKQFPGERRYRQDLANSYNWLGELLRESGRPPEKAEENYRTALALQVQLLGEAPEPAYRRELARTRYNLGLVEMDTDRPDAARADYDEAVRLLTELTEASPGNPDFRHELARACTNRGVLHHGQKRPADAEADYRQAIDLLQELQGVKRTRPDYRYNLAIASQDLGNLLWEGHQYTDALVHLHRARDLLSRLAEEFPDRPNYKKKLARTCNSLGSVLAETGKRDGAEKAWEEARKRFAELVDKDPTVADYQADLGICLGNLGWLRVECGDLPGARSSLEGAVRHLQAALKTNPKRPDYREALRNQYQVLAEALVRSGDRAAAVTTAASLAEVFPTRALDSYYAACFVARCVPLAEGDTRQTDPGGSHARQAADLLHQALAKGLTGAERLPEAEEKRIFAPLASRPDFDEVLKKLDARPRPAMAKVAP